MMQQRKPNISRFRSWWQNTSKTIDAVIVTSLVALLRIMVSWLRSWWQKIKQHPMRSTFVSIACVLGIALLIGGYFFNWTWTGFGPYVSPQTSGFQRGKTLYDWLQLAIIPAAIAFGVWSLNRLQQKRDQQLADERAKVEREAAEKRAQAERDIALDNQRETALQAYLDSMSELLLEKKLRESGKDDEMRKIARVRTITVLLRLDDKRKTIVLNFLHESKLIDKDDAIIGLYEANLSGVNFSGGILTRLDLHEVDLRRANLSYVHALETLLTSANLSGANLSCAMLNKTDLFEANLSGTNLRGTFLRDASLKHADLSYADLTGARVTTDQLDEAKSLKGATMPDGTIHA